MARDRGMTALLVAKASCCGLLLLALTGSLATWAAWAAGEGLVYLVPAVAAAVFFLARRARRARRRPAARGLEPTTLRSFSGTEVAGHDRPR